MRFIALIFTIALLNGCASVQTSTVSSAEATRHQASFIEVYSKYQGVPYRYGGMDSNGFDCSGFINVAYREAVQKTVPRTTTELAKAGLPVRRDQLQSGDVVFFETSYKQLHAGIYLDDGTFIHASTSKGVIRSSLENDYWKRRYLKARRFL